MKDKILRFSKINIHLKNSCMNLLFIFVIPILASFILGYEFEGHQIKNIPTAIVDHDNSPFSQMLVREIKTNETFNVTNYSESDHDIKNWIDEEKVRVGVIIPESFSQDLVEGKAPKVLIFYDGSQLSISSAARARMNEILLTIKTAYLEKILQGKLGIMPEVSMSNTLPMYFSYRVLNNPTRSYSEFLIPGTLISICQLGLILLGIDIASKEDKHYFHTWLKGILWGLVGACSIFITLVIQFRYFQLPYKGTVKGGIILTILFSICMVSYGMLLRFIVSQKVTAMQLGSLTSLPTSIIGGHTFPIVAMPEFFQHLSNFLPYVHYAIPIRDLCIKDLSFNYIYIEILWFVKYICYIWFISLLMFELKYITGKVKEKLITRKQKACEEVV